MMAMNWLKQPKAQHHRFCRGHSEKGCRLGQSSSGVASMSAKGCEIRLVSQLRINLRLRRMVMLNTPVEVPEATESAVTAMLGVMCRVWYNRKAPTTGATARITGPSTWIVVKTMRIAIMVAPIRHKVGAVQIQIAAISSRLRL